MAAISEDSLRWYGVPGVGLRENSLLTALIAECLAVPAQVDVRTAYTAGLLRSTGKIALERAAHQSKRTVEKFSHDGLPLVEWERNSFGSTSTAAAADVLKSWRFPADIFVPIRDHYLSALSVEPLPMATLLNLAAGAAERAGNPLVGESPYWIEVAHACASLGLLVPDAEECIKRALEKFAALRIFLQ
jgi:HD-like signal output (HDOD) protein